MSKNTTQSEVFKRVLAHELTHRAEGTKAYQEFVDAVLDIAYKGDKEKIAADLNAIYEQYKDVYGKEQGNAIYTEELIAHVAGELLSDTDAISRIVADKPSVARRMLDTIRNFINRIKGVNDPFVDQLRKVEKLMTRALESAGHFTGEMKFSLRQTQDGTKYVKVDTDQDIFEGKTKREQIKIVESYINDKYKGIVFGTDEIVVVIDKYSAGEYTHPRNGLQNKLYRAKLKAATEFDNLVAASTFVSAKGDTKNHKQYPGGFVYRKTYFDVNGNMFEGLINFGINKEGENVFYDMTKIKSIDSGLWVKEHGGVDTQSLQNQNFSKKNISEDAANVNKKFSLPSPKLLNYQINNWRNASEQQDAEQQPRQRERQFAGQTMPNSNAPGEAVQALLNDPQQLYYDPTT